MIILLAALLIAVLLFAFELIPPELTALGLMLVLVLSGIISPADGFHGFASDTVMMIAGLQIMGIALIQTGVVDAVGSTIVRVVGDRPKQLLPVVVIAVAVLSAFISNTAATAFFIPVVLGVCLKLKVSPSKYLLPLAFASIVTSSVTLISTSTNIVVSDLLTRYKQPAMGMFELFPVGIVISIAGIIYVLTVGRRLMPDRSAEDTEELDFGLRPFLTDVVILPTSTLVGKTLSESGLGDTLDLTILRIIREGRYLPARSSAKIQANDILLVEAARENILKIKDIPGVELKADAKLSDPTIDATQFELVEAVVLPPSTLIGRNLKNLRFRDRYDIQVLAINRAGPSGSKKLSEISLRSGDILLLQGDPASLKFLDQLGHLRLVSSVIRNPLNIRKAPLAAGIFALALLAATFNFISFPVAAVCGAFLALVTGCAAVSETYRQIEWSILVLIGAMLSVGIAMETTGTGKFLAANLIALTGSGNPLLLLAFVFLLSVGLTQAMSNQAAAIVMVPIAVQTALQLGFGVRPFVMMVAVAASCSYLTPLEPSCLMVYGPGKYKFRDFFIVGLPLTMIIFVIAMVLIPIFWPLK